jgi:hypothetical protein
MKTIILFILLMVIGNGLKGQQTVSSAGGTASGPGGSVSHTVGQIVYTNNSETGGSVSQGVQQPYEISVLTGLKEAGGIMLEWSAYPNPTSDNLTISIKDYEKEGAKTDDLSFKLYDISGKIVLDKRIDGNNTTIEMGGLKAGTYILRIFSGFRKEMKSFKIIKK